MTGKKLQIEILRNLWGFKELWRILESCELHTLALDSEIQMRKLHSTSSRGLLNGPSFSDLLFCILKFSSEFSIFHLHSAKSLHPMILWSCLYFTLIKLKTKKTLSKTTSDHVHKYFPMIDSETCLIIEIHHPPFKFLIHPSTIHNHNHK